MTFKRRETPWVCSRTQAAQPGDACASNHCRNAARRLSSMSVARRGACFRARRPCRWPPPKWRAPRDRTRDADGPSSAGGSRRTCRARSRGSTSCRSAWPLASTLALSPRAPASRASTSARAVRRAASARLWSRGAASKAHSSTKFGFLRPLDPGLGEFGSCFQENRSFANVPREPDKTSPIEGQDFKADAACPNDGDGQGDEGNRPE